MYTVHKARNNYDAHIVPDLMLIASEPFPDLDEDISLFEYQRIMQRDAVTILRALKASLPGGTFDRLFAEMAKEKASTLVVTLSNLEDQQ